MIPHPIPDAALFNLPGDPMLINAPDAWTADLPTRFRRNEGNTDTPEEDDTGPARPSSPAMFNAIVAFLFVMALAAGWLAYSLGGQG